MKVLLLFPPGSIPKRNIQNCSPPLGLAYLGAALEDAGHQVKVVDCQVEGFRQVTRLSKDRIRFGLSPRQMADTIRMASPDVVGISCPFSQMGEQAKEVARLAKDFAPDAWTLMGGVHPSLFPDDPLSEQAVDIVFRGQGDLALPELLKQIETGKDPSAVAGVVRRGESPVERSETGPPPFLTDLDVLPFPAWHLFPIEKYMKINLPHGGQASAKRVLPVITSRGCPFRCTFCNAAVFWGHRIAFRSPGSVVEEIKWLSNEYRVEEIHFEDENLTANPDRALALFELMASEGLAIKWNIPNGVAVDTLDEKLIKAMAKSGCYEVALAVESGVPRVLTEIIGKPNFLPKLPAIVKTCKQQGLFVHGFFVVGWPGETMAEVKATLRTPVQMGFLDATFLTWFPVPGTALYQRAVSDGYIDPDEIQFSTIHMTNRIKRLKGITTPELWKLLAKANWHIKLRLLRHPQLFFRRFVGPFMKNPRFGVQYVWDQLRLGMGPSGGKNQIF